VYALLTRKSEEILSQPTRQLAARSVPLKRAELDRLRKELEEVSYFQRVCIHFL
jgi:hypothetical protein